MFAKLISLFASMLMLLFGVFTPLPAAPEQPEVLKENEPEETEMRTNDKITGVGGTEFYIARPAGELREVNASDFGLSPEKDDNFPALKEALAYCRENPGTKLTVGPGQYYLKNTETLVLNGFTDVLISCGGAEFVFSEVHNGFSFTGCDCVELNGLTIGWDWEKLPLSDLAIVKSASKKKHTVDFVFPDGNADENMIFSAVSQADEKSYTYGAKGSNKEVYVYQRPECIVSVEKTADDTLRVTHDGCFDNLREGEAYLIRHYVYDSTCIGVSGMSRNVTFDGLKIYGWPGSGFYGGERASHFQIVNTYIGAEPGKTGRHTSLGSDAIHIACSDGCFNVENCDISLQGDDALNVHDSLGCVEQVNGDTVVLKANALHVRVGDTLGFRDEKFNATDVSAVVVSDEYDAAQALHTIRFDRALTGLVEPDWIAYSLTCSSANYVIRNNYFHENRARGLLLQSSGGLCENNRFYRTEMQAIKVIMDVTHGLWYEGTGVDGLTVRNNEFTECDYIHTGEVITVGTNIDGKEAVSQPFSSIEITGNEFRDFPGAVLRANNVNGLVFTGNTVDPGKDFAAGLSSARAYFGRYCTNVTFGENEWNNCLSGMTAKAQTPMVWADANSD